MKKIVSFFILSSALFVFANTGEVYADNETARAEPLQIDNSAEVTSQNEKKGVVTYLEGKAKKKMIDEEDWLSEVEQNGVVQSRESYKTMKKSRAELELSGLDIIRLAPKTTIDLVALYEENLAGKKQTKLSLKEGDLWAQVNSADEDNEFEMDTDIAAAAITGTNFRLSKDKGLTKMKVYHGEVKITNSKGKLHSLKPMTLETVSNQGPKEVFGPKKVAGPKEVTLSEWIYIVKNFEQITFDASGKVVSSGKFSATDNEERTNWIKWNKKLDRKRGLK